MKDWRLPVALTVIIVVLAGILVGVLLFMKNQPLQTRGVQPIVQVAAQEPDSAKWGVNFPNQWSTLQLTKTNNVRTTYGGSENYSKLEVDPRLVRLFAGYGFSKGYTEDRGHMNTLIDVRESARINDKTPATCYSCKSADNPKLWKEMGMADYDAMPFAQMTPNINQAVGCANCHETGTMRLIVTNPALEEALKAQGKDWTTFTRQEMRTVVCANCHVEYYFAGEGKYLTFPWVNGTKIEDIEKYYQDIQFTDWTHPDSQAAMIKMQHPEYEMFTAGSTHFKAGVSCADCHMPYTRDGSIKFSSHDVHSPLLNASASCGACHTDVDYVTERVAAIQDQVWQTMSETENALVDAIDSIKVAGETAGVDETALTKARELHRAAQLRWDFVAAENSMGFHNPEEVLRILAASTNLARQAQIMALTSVSQSPTASK